jgi:hypothetical protein
MPLRGVARLTIYSDRRRRTSTSGCIQRAAVSRLASLARQLGMSKNGNSVWRWLAAAVVAHLVVSIVHGTAHDGAHVPLTPAANLFVFIVILAGPLVGLALTWPAKRIGSWLIAMTMTGSLLFGVVNHFVLPSPDHVAHVAADWRPLFTTTAILLVVTEGLGAGLAIRVARERKQVS